MSTMASQITSLTIVYSTVYSGADQRKYQSSASLAFVWGIHRWLVNSPHKGPVTRKMFPFDDVIMYWEGTDSSTWTQGQNKVKFFLHSQFRGCWWLGDARSQGIRSHQTLQKYSSLSIKRMNSNCYICYRPITSLHPSTSFMATSHLCFEVNNFYSLNLILVLKSSDRQQK